MSAKESGGLPMTQPAEKADERKTPMNPKQSAERLIELDKLATAGPWQKCSAHDGQCQCTAIWSVPADAPIIDVHQKWGDYYATMIGSGESAEARIEFDEHGSMPVEEMQSNKDWVAESRTLAPEVARWALELDKLVGLAIEARRLGVVADEHTDHADGGRIGRACRSPRSTQEAGLLTQLAPNDMSTENIKFIPTERMIVAAAGAIANARAGRRGAPNISNVLSILPARLHAEVMEDAEAALNAAFDAQFEK